MGRLRRLKKKKNNLRNLYDNNYSDGDWGMVLRSNGTGFEWVATSTLGITGGSGTFDGLTDTNVSSLSWGHMLIWDGNDWVNKATSTLGLGGGSGSGTVGFGALGSLAFYNGAGTTATGTDISELFWDNSNNRLGIGSSSP